MFTQPKPKANKCKVILLGIYSTTVTEIKERLSRQVLCKHGELVFFEKSDKLVKSLRYNSVVVAEYFWWEINRWTVGKL